MIPKVSTNNNLLRFDLQKTLKNSNLKPKELTSFQRILLTTDGMVTEILEAYLWERMKVVKLFQDYFRLDEDIDSLAVRTGTNVLQRKILLRGETSKKNHIYAESIIVPDRLDQNVRIGLLHSNKPIGLLILENRIETFREILTCGREPANHLSEYFNIEKDEGVIFRSYRMIAKNKPIMLITEKFYENAPQFKY